MAERRYRRIELTTTYQKISNGFREEIAKCSAAWRASSTDEPGANDYVLVAADERHPLARDGETFARAETGTAVIYVTSIR